MTPLELKLTDRRRTLAILWENGNVSRLSATLLRRNSRAADSVRAALDGQTFAADELELTEIEPIGAYAVRLGFSDGHDRGIFPWAYLRQIADASV